VVDKLHACEGTADIGDDALPMIDRIAAAATPGAGWCGFRTGVMGLAAYLEIKHVVRQLDGDAP